MAVKARRKSLLGAEFSQRTRDLIKSRTNMDSRIEKWRKIVDFRPDLKIYNGVFPKDKGELETLKNLKACQGVLMLFDPLDSEITDLKEIVQLRPLLEFSNGHIPADSTMSKAACDRACEGYLIIFKRLNDAEHEAIYGKPEAVEMEVSEDETTAV